MSMEKHLASIISQFLPDSLFPDESFNVFLLSSVGCDDPNAPRLHFFLPQHFQKVN